MRPLRLLDAYRNAAWERNISQGMTLLDGERDEVGAFIIPSPRDNRELRVVASTGEGWDHVSVSRADRTPSWEEMEHIKRLFFKDDECAMQLHVPVQEHLNHHPHCLHLWRPHGKDIPRPPANLIAPKPKG